MLHFELNFKSGKPAYLQVVEQVKHALATGRLEAGEKLPSIRALAEHLRINRNTVAKAYGELEHEGVVETRQGQGVFCRKAGSDLAARARRRILAEALDGVVVQAYHLRVDGEELVRMLEERLEEFEKRRERGE